MAIYARKTLLLLLKIEGGTLGLGKDEKSHSAEKVMKRGDPWTMPPTFANIRIFLVHCETRTHVPLHLRTLGQCPLLLRTFEFFLVHCETRTHVPLHLRTREIRVNH